MNQAYGFAKFRRYDSFCSPAYVGPLKATKKEISSVGTGDIKEKELRFVFLIENKTFSQ